MQELEKILKDIENEALYNREIGRKHCEGIAKAINIIRKHMNDDNEIVEQCPHCENEVMLHWDVEKDGYEVYCPYCGFPIMLCSMCDVRDGTVCDWREEKGCKHSNERYCNYFRKHMNDGWILVEERLPEDGQSVLCTDGKYAYLVEYDADLDAGFCDMDDIIAWQPLPKVYRPERSEGK